MSHIAFKNNKKYKKTFKTLFKKNYFKFYYLKKNIFVIFKVKHITKYIQRLAKMILLIL